MLARVAEALYWTARNLERADDTGRMLELSHAFALDSSGDPAGPGVWMPAVIASGGAKVFTQNHLRASERSVVWFLTFSEINPNSMRACTMRARANARGVRDALPPEVWEEINSLARAVGQWTPRRLAHDGVFTLCRIMRRALHQVEGAMDAEMRRDEAWHFLRIGRFLERASTAARLLEARWRIIGDRAIAPGDRVAPDEWHALVGAAVAPAVMMAAAPGALTAEAAVRLLVADERFPRSVRYSLDRVEDSLLELEAMGAAGRRNTGRDLVAEARNRVYMLDPLPVGPDLTRFLDEIQERCNLIGTHIASCFFDYRHEDPTGHDRQRPQAARQAQN